MGTDDRGNRILQSLANLAAAGRLSFYKCLHDPNMESNDFRETWESTMT